MQSATVLELTVNGERHRITEDPKAPLLLVLRNSLKLYAAKFGCGFGQCGACFVLLNGHPTQSCDVPVESAVGADIRTLEGLDVQALQATFVELQAGQCGYCLSGILVTASTLSKKGRKLDRQEIAAALNRHLCRCGSHARIIEAVYQAQER